MAATGEIQKVAIVGTGVIGASWAALFLARGLDVDTSLFGPPGSQKKLFSSPPSPQHVAF